MTDDVWNLLQQCLASCDLRPSMQQIVDMFENMHIVTEPDTHSFSDICSSV